jgi:short-subunit dehydrogenase
VDKETVLITGASSGIGWELAKLFAASGSRLVLVARRRDRLEALANELRSQHGTESRLLIEDLGRPGAAQQVFDATSAEGPVDVLVNNAGFGLLGRFRKLPLDRQREMLQLNVTALTELSRLYLPGMIERRRGGLLNIGSTASFQPGPNAAVYYASKAYVLSFTEALVTELAGTGVTSTCLAPGPTHTGFGDLSGMGSTPVFRFGSMPADAVARAGYRAFRRRRSLVVPGLCNKALIFVQRFSARWLVRRIVSDWMQPFTDGP